MKILLILLMLVLFPGVKTSAQSIQEIHISSSRHGWGTEEMVKTITHRSNGYFDGKVAIPKKLVVALENAINAPIVEKLDLDSLGITQEWLDANADAAMREIAPTPKAMHGEWTAAEKELFLSTFRDRTKIASAVHNHYKGFWTDDYPHVSIKIKFKDRKTILLESKVQQSYMIPWTLDRDGARVKNFNPDISRALAAMMPESFPNQIRISGAELRYKIAELIKYKLREPLGLMNTEVKIGKQLIPVKEEFEIIQSQIGTRWSIDVEPDIKQGQYSAWNAKLTRKGQSPQIQIGVSLPYVNNQVTGLDAFQKNTGKYLSLTASVPWLQTYLSTHPESKIEIRYVNDRSLSKKALQGFIEDMQKLNKSYLSERVSRDGMNVVFLEVESGTGEGSRWIIDSDRRMILWMISKNQALGWKTSDFKTIDCHGQQCVGAVISELGEIVQTATP